MSSEIKGLLMGERILNYINTVVFVDKQNNLMGEVNFFREVSRRVYFLRIWAAVKINNIPYTLE
jgi:hypothetical protein